MKTRSVAQMVRASRIGPTRRFRTHTAEKMLRNMTRRVPDKLSNVIRRYRTGYCLSISEVEMVSGGSSSTPAVVLSFVFSPEPAEATLSLPESSGGK